MNRPYSLTSHPFTHTLDARRHTSSHVLGLASGSGITCLGAPQLLPAITVPSAEPSPMSMVLSGPQRSRASYVVVVLMCDVVVDPTEAHEKMVDALPVRCSPAPRPPCPSRARPRCACCAPTRSPWSWGLSTQNRMSVVGETGRRTRQRHTTEQRTVEVHEALERVLHVAIADVPRLLRPVHHDLVVPLSVQGLSVQFGAA